VTRTVAARREPDRNLILSDHRPEAAQWDRIKVNSILLAEPPGYAGRPRFPPARDVCDESMAVSEEVP